MMIQAITMAVVLLACMVVSVMADIYVCVMADNNDNSRKLRVRINQWCVAHSYQRHHSENIIFRVPKLTGQRRNNNCGSRRTTTNVATPVRLAHTTKGTAFTAT